MKIFLLILITSYFLSFTNTSHANDNSYDPMFTITHKATNDEKVIIYLIDKKREDDIFSLLDPYTVEPNECLLVRASQFDQLTVRLGVGGGQIGGSQKAPCLAYHSRYGHHPCKPNHYAIVDAEGWKDYYRMVPSTPNNSQDCIRIEQWMDSKK